MCLRYQRTLLLVALTFATLGSVSSTIECSKNIFEERGVILPKSAILSDGDNLTLTCVYQHPIDYNVSSEMYFMFSGVEQQHRVINDTTIQLTKHNVTHGDGNAGVYTCFAKCQGGQDTVGNRKVEIYVNPEPPEKLRCVSNNYNDVNCSWCPSDGAIPDGVSWTATWSLVNESNQPKNQNCHKNYSPCNCYICGNYFKTVSDCPSENRFRRGYKVEIQLVTKVDQTGKNVNKTFEIDPKYITKPRPVKSFEAIVISSRSIELWWEPPPFLNHDTIAMNYSVSYTSKWTTDIKSVMFGPYSKQRETVSEYLTNLTPYTNYTVTIRPVPCKHNDGDFFGDPRQLFNQTAEDAPEFAPVAFRGSFRSESCINRRNDGLCRNIIFYWRNIKERYWNGIVTNCTLTVSGISAPSRVDCPHVHKHKLTLTTDGEHRAQMAMYTAAGPSPPAEWHLVNLNEAEELFPRDIAVEVVPGHDEKLLEFEWSRPAWQEPISDYTIFYGKKDLTDDFQNLTAVYLGPENTSYSLGLEGASTAYNLAMSTQTEGRSSGMTPPLCVYMYNKEPRNINLKLAHVQSERSLKLIWEKLYCQSSYQYGKPGKIQISWQRSESQALKDANGRREMADSRVSEKSETLPPTATEYTILDLLPYTSYNVTAKVISTRNIVSNIDVHVTTLESKPEDSPTIVNITGITSTSFTVQWRPPSKPNGQIVEYILNYTNTETQISKEIIQGTSRKATVPDLEALTGYTVMVKARNGGNFESNYSDPKTVTTKATATPSWAVAVAILGCLLLGILLIFLTWCCWNRWKNWIYDIKPVDLKPVEITREAEDIEELVDKQEGWKETERRSDGSFSDVVINPKRSPQTQISKSSNDSGVFENDKETSETQQGRPDCSEVAENPTYFTSSRVNPTFSGDSDGSIEVKDFLEPDGAVNSAGHQEGRPVSSDDVSQYDKTNEAYLKVVDNDDYVPTAIQIQRPDFLDSSGVTPETIQSPSQEMSSYSRINGYVKQLGDTRKDTKDETDGNFQNLAANFSDVQFLKTWPPNGYIPKDFNFGNLPDGMVLQNTKCSLQDGSDLTSDFSGTTTDGLVWSSGDSGGGSSAADNYATTLLHFDKK